MLFFQKKIIFVYIYVIASVIAIVYTLLVAFALVIVFLFSIQLWPIMLYITTPYSMFGNAGTKEERGATITLLMLACSYVVLYTCKYNLHSLVLYQPYVDSNNIRKVTRT